MPKQSNPKKNNNFSRRKFIRNGSLAAAGFYIVPRHVLGGVGYTAPSDKLVIASVGAGGKGGDDIRHFVKTGKADVAFLCDVDDRRSAGSRKLLPKAKYYNDWREMFDKENKNFDAVSVSIPDHNHAIVALNAMKLGKHTWTQKPLTHDIYEARILAEASKKYKVVTQMGNQGGSSDGVRQLMDWYNAGLIGEVHTVHCWTNRPVWPQGIAWPTANPPVPKELKWDLWLGTADYTDYENNLVPFNWRGWWMFGTGALGDMGCHIIDPPFRVLSLGYPDSVESSLGTVYVGEFKQGYFPKSCPPSSSNKIMFKRNGKPDLTLTWMDGGIQPFRPEELGPNEPMGDSDGRNGALFIGDKGKMMCGTYGFNPQLLPTSKTGQVHVPQTVKRVPGGAEGHYAQWINGAIAGYGNTTLSSPFDFAGPLTETVLMSNLALRSYDIRVPKEGKEDQYDYPGRDIKFLWDGQNMKVTNFKLANQFVKRDYRKGWGELTLS